MYAKETSSTHEASGTVIRLRWLDDQTAIALDPKTGADLYRITVRGQDCDIEMADGSPTLMGLKEFHSCRKGCIVRYGGGNSLDLAMCVATSAIVIPKKEW